MATNVMQSNRRNQSRRSSSRQRVVIIGGGQAGLAMGHYLAQRGQDFLILDAEQRTGDVWRRRWDSLRLFTPARFSGLPGMRFPAEAEYLPGKDEVGDYLEAYAAHFGLPIRHGEKVVRLVKRADRFLITTQGSEYDAEQVVVATGPFQTPLVPAVSNGLSDAIVQLHSSEYRAPSQLPNGDVLVVGGGNSGVQIAAELSSTRRTWLAVGHAMPTLPDRFLGRSIFWWLEATGAMKVNVRSRLGRRASQREFLIGKSVREAQRIDAVRVVGRAQHAKGNTVFTSDGAVVEPSAVIWATGFRQEYRWIDVPVFDQRGKPVHDRGITAINGLYFLGLPWLHTRGSALLGWVGRDAGYLSEKIAVSPTR